MTTGIAWSAMTLDIWDKTCKLSLFAIQVLSNALVVRIGFARAVVVVELGLSDLCRICLFTSLFYAFVSCQHHWFFIFIYRRTWTDLRTLWSRWNVACQLQSFAWEPSLFNKNQICPLRQSLSYYPTWWLLLLAFAHWRGSQFFTWALSVASFPDRAHTRRDQVMAKLLPSLRISCQRFGAEHAEVVLELLRRTGYLDQRASKTNTCNFARTHTTPHPPQLCVFVPMHEVNATP